MAAEVDDTAPLTYLLLGAVVPPLVLVAYQKLRQHGLLDGGGPKRDSDERLWLHEDDEMSQQHSQQRKGDHYDGTHEEQLIKAAAPEPTAVVDVLLDDDEPPAPVAEAYEPSMIFEAPPQQQQQQQHPQQLTPPPPEPPAAALKVHFVLGDFKFTIGLSLEGPPPATLPQLVELLAAAGTEKARRPLASERLVIEYGLDSGSDEPLWLTATSATHVGSVIAAAHGLRVTEVAVSQPSLAPPPPMPSFEPTAAPDLEVAARLTSVAKKSSPALAWLASVNNAESNNSTMD